MTPTIEQIKEILAGAPDGATHYIETEFSTFHLKDDDTGFYVYENNQWKRDYVEDFGVTESLLPLRTILTLHEEIEQQQAQIAELTDALDHIARVANSSRTQSRRDRWICLRANCAISSSDEWKTADLPKIIENSRGRELRLRAENQELAATVERLLKACELARDNYGKMLMTDPPQEAWRARQVTERLVEAIKATPHQNLNAVKRGAIIDALNYSDGRYIETHSDYLDMVVEYANTNYPSWKE